MGDVQMIKYKIEFTKEEVKELYYYYINGRTKKIRLRAGVLYLRSKEKSYREIVEVLGVPQNTINTYIKGYIDKDIDFIFETNYRKNISELEEYKDIIINDFDNNPPATVDEARIRIEKLTGLKRGNTAVRTFLKKKDIHSKKQEAYQRKQIKRNKDCF